MQPFTRIKTFESYWFTFYQILPLYPEYMDMVFFPIKADYLQVAPTYFQNLDEDIKRLVHYKKENEKWYYEDDDKGEAFMPDEKKAYFWLELVADKVFLKYRELFNAINTIAGYVEDTHFFAEDEFEAWVDEFLITEGKLTARRYIAKEPYIDYKLEILEELAAGQKQYTEFQSALSDYFYFSGESSLVIWDIKDIDQAGLEESINYFNKSLYYNLANRKAKEMKETFENRLKTIYLADQPDSNRKKS